MATLPPPEDHRRITGDRGGRERPRTARTTEATAGTIAETAGRNRTG
ncbi:hypothetical protein SSCG_01325 [Streptomyces clavuligerus]|nr:hypothetical protein SSCG_01325 [Streptomyces clavuligerus]